MRARLPPILVPRCLWRCCSRRCDCTAAAEPQICPVSFTETENNEVKHTLGPLCDLSLLYPEYKCVCVCVTDRLVWSNHRKVAAGIDPGINVGEKTQGCVEQTHTVSCCMTVFPVIINPAVTSTALLTDQVSSQHRCRWQTSVTSNTSGKNTTQQKIY